MIIRMIAAIGMFVILVTSGMTAGHEESLSAIAIFIDIPSILIVIGIVSTGTIWSYPFATTAQAFKDTFTTGELEEERALQGYLVFQSMAEYAVGGGIIGTVIGLVKMLSNLDDPTAIGPAMAVALLTILYGVMLGEVVFKSMANSCLSKNPAKWKRDGGRGFVTLYATLCILFVLTSCFMTMLLAFASFE